MSTPIQARKEVTRRGKNAPAMDTLLESMNQLADSAARKMTADEMRKARKEINESIDRVVAGGRRRRRETT